MMPYRHLSQPLSFQLPINETGTLIPSMTLPEKQGRPTSPIAGLAVTALYLSTMVALILVILIFSWQISMPVMIMEEPTVQTKTGKCVVPAYPEHGTYSALKPGERFESLNLTVTCLPGYGVLETENVYCQNGSWSDYIPKCVRFCKLDKHTSVHYHCLVTGSIDEYRACNAYEPSGTIVKPECNSPNYYSTVTLPSITCIDGSWDRAVVCSPECGRVPPKAVPLITDERPAKQGEHAMPWHVGIYRKNRKPYTQICGGSIISERLVISAAHCFWNDIIKVLPASDFAVAAGKSYRPWNNPRDMFVQKSDVKDIKIPDHFQGAAANYQADISLIILETAFVYNSFVRPVCLDFDGDFDRRQLQPGKLGKVAGWGLTGENGSASKTLKVNELPYVGIKECYAESPGTFREFITSDKICARSGNGTSICKGAGGSGLAFPESERGKERHYFRGIASTAATNENLCYSNMLITFTHIRTHEYFIRQYL